MVKLNSIIFEDLSSGLKCEEINFNTDMTLLVGLSGVGKSQILKAISRSFRYALNDGATLSPYVASLNFSINGKNYVWSYRVEEIQDFSLKQSLISKKNSCEFIYEELTLNNEQIMLRDIKNNKMILKDFNDFPQPKNSESLLSQYKDEKIYIDILNDFGKLCPLDIDMDIRGMIGKTDFLEFKKIIEKEFYSSESRNFDDYSGLPPIFKLFIAKEYFSDSVYVQIFNYVKELFPEINDINIIEDKYADAFAISINVYDKNIYQRDISNGMLKAIYYIIELVTARSNSLILIDEFENGLGVNCLDTLAELLLYERNDLQYIITSHHPKIIGGVPADKWRIIDRDVSTIKNSLSDVYGINNSRHNSYFNLINRWEFEGKI